MEDRLLKTLVEDELQYEPSIDAADVAVRVDRGIVHVSGRVPTYAQKFAIEARVKKIKGVRGFVTEIKVQPFGDPQSDDAIAARVANLLEWDVTVPNDKIKVKVEGGAVTLSGQVDWAYQRQAAEAGIRRLPGVRDLFNMITVKPRVDTHDVRKRIESALKRQADIEADHVSVVVDGGKVKLSGKVRAWYERDLIERAAWSAPGVTAVEDDLRLAT